MRLNRILPHFFTSEVQEEEITKKYEKSFEEILQEERGKLMRLISEAKAFEDMKQFYIKCSPGMMDNMFIEE